MTILINEIEARDKWDDPAYLRSADQMIVRHQMFVLFSPLGAMFTYQALVATGAAGQSITVAVAVLGAGATLPYLLDYATQKSVSVLKGATRAEE